MRNRVRNAPALPRLVFCLAALASTAASAAPSALTEVRVAALKGPTGIGMAPLVTAQPSFGTGLHWSYAVLPSPLELVARVASREVDVAVLPANTAAKLYTDGPGYRMGAIVGWGVLYLVSRDTSVAAWSDLRGKEVLCVGKGASPDFVTRFLLAKSGLEADVDVRLNFSFAQEQVAQLVIAGRADYAILPEPFVTQVLSRSPEVRIAIDLQAQWAAAAGTKQPYPISVVVVSPSLMQQSPEAVAAFLQAYADSIRWVNSHVAEAAAMVGKLDIMPEAVARAAIPRCNLDFVSGAAARAAMEAYLGVLNGFDATAVGSRLPDAGFYPTR
jgi:NitT/TauT family transport system substrate-binding protein